MILGRARKQQSNFQVPWRLVIKTALFVLFLAVSFLYVNKIKFINEFPIHQVKIYGVKHLNAQETQHMLLPLVSKGFFGVEVDLIKEQLLQVPWVADVSVRRVWPDQVVIAISEKNPIARWNENSLLSSTGEVFNPALTSYPADLPHFVGPEGKQATVLAFYTEINQLLNPLHLKIKRLELSPYLSWDMEFGNGMKVRLGYKDVLTRVGHFVKVYSKIVGERADDVDYVDLRYPNGLAVRWKTA